MLFFRVSKNNHIENRNKESCTLAQSYVQTENTFLQTKYNWYLHQVKVTNKKLVKACQSILQAINETHFNLE